MSDVRVLATGLEFPEGPVVLPDGSVVLVEIRGRRLTRVWPDGRKEVVAEIPGGPNGAAMGPEGTWSTPLRLPDGGSYRVFADFAHEGRPTTLAGDLRVDGTADLEALPAPQPVATSDGGYDVRLAAAAARPGHESTLRFAVTKGGRPVGVEPYLGASGHLVALREGDLAFLHVHPVQRGAFQATFPTAGRYRLFLQFRVAGRVQTVAFTREVR